MSVGVSDALLAAAAGDRPDAAPLRVVATRRVVVSDAEPALRDEVVRSLHAMAAESRAGTALSRPYLVAHLALALVAVWRLTSHTLAEVPAAMGSEARLRRLLHLV